MKTRLNRILLLGILLFSFVSQSAFGRVDTLSVYSEKMDLEVKNVVILPQSYNSTTRYPVVYLLHGHGGNHKTWLDKTCPQLKELASLWNLIIVCPDGKSSWYWDSPIDPKLQYETFVSKELVKYIDRNYQTIPSREGRAVTGFSMGGHGGLWLGMNHPDVFGACGSMSGGVDIRPFPQSWNMKDALGTYSENKDIWDAHTVMTQVDKFKDANLSIIIDCGFDDFFFSVNEKFHRELLANKIPHDYITRPGVHTHAYWREAVEYQLLFFVKFFNKK